MSCGKWQPFCLGLNDAFQHVHVGGIPDIYIVLLTAHDLAPNGRQTISNTNLYQTLRNKLQWKFNRNSNIFIQENALENVVCEMASILSRPQGVKWDRQALAQWQFILEEDIHDFYVYWNFQQVNRATQFSVNSSPIIVLRPRQNSGLFADDIVK